MKTTIDVVALPTAGELREDHYDTNNPFTYVVSLAEYHKMQTDKCPEIEGLSYEEYNELERECWNEMLKVQLEEPWMKSLPESLLKPERYKIQKRYQTKNPLLRGMILKAMQKSNFIC